MNEISAALRAEHIRVWFPVRNALGHVVNHVKAVDDVSLSLLPGKTYGLVGESGCGKSTLGRALCHLVPTTEGSVSLMGKEIAPLSDRDMLPYRRTIQMVFQDPYTSLDPRQRVGRMLMEVQKIHHIGSSSDERMARAMDILSQVGLLKEHFYRYPHEFSGGQRQRIGLARALILDPRVMICDEPVSALDVSIQSQVINLLRDLQAARLLSYLFISHDMSVIKYISDRVGVMYLGHLVEEADVDTLFANPIHPYTKTLMSAVPSIDPRQSTERIVLKGELPSPIDPPGGCVFHTRCPFAGKECQVHVPALQEVTPGHFAACPRMADRH